ncbi:hypothetical protein B0H17DRAFT_1139705 [Mycena rosella]|uniref:Uncharacterized protein n=1 Tax=Mycena rosella TaxID=1033263 RepID=A0AAD7D3T4_MYCRO|nr:hypothetical protein B0H17DRAFT_1139705 [Mycena rosella]
MQDGFRDELRDSSSPGFVGQWLAGRPRLIHSSTRGGIGKHVEEISASGSTGQLGFGPSNAIARNRDRGTKIWARYELIRGQRGLKEMAVRRGSSVVAQNSAEQAPHTQTVIVEFTSKRQVAVHSEVVNSIGRRREQKYHQLISAIRVYHLHQASCGFTSTSQLKKAETGNARIFTQKFDHGGQEKTRPTKSGS